MNTKRFVIQLTLALVFAAAASAGVAQRAASMPGLEKGGLASLYLGDEGIERDPRVLFVDDFETGTPEEIGARWGSISRKENINLSDDIHADSPGYKSIHIARNGHLYTHTKGVDTIYARFYVKSPTAPRHRGPREVPARHRPAMPSSQPELSRRVDGANSLRLASGTSTPTGTK